MLHEHYWEMYLFFGMALILAVYILVYSILLWFGKRRSRHARLTHAEEMYRVKGYTAWQNTRRS